MSPSNPAPPQRALIVTESHLEASVVSRVTKQLEDMNMRLKVGEEARGSMACEPHAGPRVSPHASPVQAPV
jgi:hypothetical protein